MARMEKTKHYQRREMIGRSDDGNRFTVYNVKFKNR